MRTLAVTLALLAGLTACSGTPGSDEETRRGATPTPAPATGPPATSTAPPNSTAQPGRSPTADPVPSPSLSPDAPLEIRYRIERRTTDPETADFAEVVEATLEDPRGWERAGFDFVRDPDAPYLIVLAEGDEVDRLCAPYDTAGRYSCQNGPVVALNADRWREATPEWTGDLPTYKQMLVNHEVGHLLHLHHPVEPQCPEPGEPAPVMAQQSTELGECLPNPWPLEWEIELASERREPLAPPASHDPSDHRPTPP